MNWTELLVAIVSHVSWPMTIITLTWMFRDPLRSAMGRIESANSKFLKLTLRSHESIAKLNFAEGLANGLQLPMVPDSKRKSKAELTELQERLKQITALAVRQPPAALFSVWDLLMQLTGLAIEKKNGSQPPSDQIIPEAAKCFEQGIVSLMVSLLTIVEQQKSNPSNTIDKDFVFRFINLTHRVILSINKVEPTITGDIT